MHKTREDKISSIKTSARSVALLILCVMSFIVFLWVISVVVRLIIGIGA